MSKLYWGIDIGSVSLKSVLLHLPDSGTGSESRASHRLLHDYYVYTDGHPLRKFETLCREIEHTFPDIEIDGVCITGSGKPVLAGLYDLPVLNEIIAHSIYAWHHFPDVRSIIEIGGQDSKYILINKKESGKHYVENHMFNGICSAGTGAFLDQQCLRMGLSIETFSDMAYRAAVVPSIAGRCSVFAKSDMVHLQQKGTTQEEIAAGLCHALARNYLGTLLKGKLPPKPILFQGGLASNRGMVRAFSRILQLPEYEIHIPAHHRTSGAYGAALSSFKNHLKTKIKIKDLLPISTFTIPSEEHAGALARLKRPEIISVPAADTGNDAATDMKSGWIGLDIGSVATKGVLINGVEEILLRHVVPTKADPIEAARNIFTFFSERLRSDFVLKGLYATGSGRYTVKHIYSADGTVDEISAQTKGALKYFPDVDTIFEIGGQDSKFIRIKDGVLRDFRMNRMCAAGTGSFLQEQSSRLDVKIESEFSDLAFDSRSPVEMRTRCTVFMDSDLVHHIQHGQEKSELCAGLAYSAAKNYLEMIVGHHNLGSKIIFQGGVARNSAVHAALEQQINQNIASHPEPEYSGALGAALYAKEELPDKESRFTGIHMQVKPYATGTFTCQGCENSCEILNVHSGSDMEKNDAGVSYFGSLCGKYTGRQEPGPPVEESRGNYIRQRNGYLIKQYSYRDVLPERGKIGLPLALTLYEHLPFWSTFFRSLGFEPVISGRTTDEIAHLGIENMPVETCMPIRVLFGHALYLKQQGTDKIFVPSTRSSCLNGDSREYLLCPYTQAIPYLIKSKTACNTLMLPFPKETGPQGERKVWIRRAAAVLNIPKKEISEAMAWALNAQNEFLKLCRSLGERALHDIRQEGSVGIVLLGRPYIVYDEYLNMALVRKMEKLGNRVLAPDLLPLESVDVSSFWDDLHWFYGRQELKAAAFVREGNLLSAVNLTTFGCGPDAFILQCLQGILDSTPYTTLEFDENRADTGMITRIEAFTRNIAIPAEVGGKGWKREDPSSGKRLFTPEGPIKNYKFFIERFSDHSYAFSGALRAAGCEAEVLPQTDEKSWQLARKYSHGSECHPYLAMLGDLLRLSDSLEPEGKEAIYYAPKYDGACLVNAYRIAMHLALERLGRKKINLLNLGDFPVFKELGIIYPYYLGLGIYVIDRLYKWAKEITPYEKNNGEVRKVHSANLLLIEKMMAERKIFRGIKQAVQNMESIELNRSEKKPVIGIAGDIFTRVNEKANDGLFDKLKAYGFETWSSSMIMDLALFGFEQKYKIALEKGQVMKARLLRIWTPAARIYRWHVDRFFPRDIHTPQENSFPKILRTVDPHLSHFVDGLVTLNLSRMCEFKAAGADGVINAMCPNCVVGTVSEAFFPVVQNDDKPIPVETLLFSDQQMTHLDNRLEAFAARVKDLVNS
jgi:predicted CoA-substrate-specific enzyme activase